MKVIKDFPPNYDSIKVALPNCPVQAIFSYGDIIYNPSGRDIPTDQIKHEEIHAEEQKKIGMDSWWALYLQDPEFRLTEEIKAYGEQFKLAKAAIEEATEKASKAGKYLQAGKNNLI